jgi:hypothetical protein
MSVRQSDRDRLMRTRMSGGVGGREGNPPGYPIMLSLGKLCVILAACHGGSVTELGIAHQSRYRFGSLFVRACASKQHNRDPCEEGNGKEELNTFHRLYLLWP